MVNVGVAPPCLPPTHQGELYSLDNYQKVLKLKPDLPEIYYNLGGLRSTMGDKQGAIADLQKAAQLFSEQGNKAGYQKVQEILSQLK